MPTEEGASRPAQRGSEHGSCELGLTDIASSSRSPPEKPDDRTAAEEREYEKAWLERYKFETDSLVQDTNERKKYAARLFWLAAHLRAPDERLTTPLLPGFAVPLAKLFG